MSARGTTNTNARGSAASRRARKVWLLAQFGNGTCAPCAHCGALLVLRVEVPERCGSCPLQATLLAITVDRIVPGIEGGRYVRANIRPACMRCNSLDGTRLREARKAAPVKRQTPKQVLRGHIENWHHRYPAASWTARQMADWHAEQHHRYATSHVHEGLNLGPHQRPPGWRTGEGAQRRDRTGSA